MVDPYLEEQILDFLMSSRYRSQTELINYISNKRNNTYYLQDITAAVRQLSSENKLHRHQVDRDNIFLIKIKEEIRDQYYALIQQHNMKLAKALSALIGVSVPHKLDRELRRPRRSQDHRDKMAANKRKRYGHG